MQKVIALLTALFISVPTVGTAAEGDLESLMWQLVSTSEEVSKLEAFIESYPDSVHLQEARAIIEQLKLRENVYELEESIFDSIGQVSFDQPLAFGNQQIIGRTLLQILDESPAYPPVEGLPEAMWKENTCQDCHSWTREALCVQAGNYVAMDPGKYREKLHPFGGLLKINLRNWAQNGCS
jgi:tetrahydromethanopterin S-methyltransferase subunit B